jgi:ligand-binding sensor domain-containing protein/serine phosphatase RsbU (regulator of sigma subunit)
MRKLFGFLTLFCLASSQVIYAQSQIVSFKHLSTNEGLSHSHVNTILKDSQGFVWFGTDEGLNKYDGYEITVYKHNARLPTSICSNVVNDLLEDKAGNLWIATPLGLDRFDRNSNIFVHYPSKGKPLFIQNLLQDRKGQLWVGSAQGVFRLDRASSQFQPLNFLSQVSSPLPAQQIVYKLFEDTKGLLWIGTEGGLVQYNPLTRQSVVYNTAAPVNRQLPFNQIRDIVEDAEGNVWIGTFGGGLCLLNQTSQTLSYLQHQVGNSNSLSSNTILSLLADDKGTIWIGTENGGVSRYDSHSKQFTHYTNDPTDLGSLSNNSVYSLYKDQEGTFWMGTWSGGVNILPKYANKFVHYKQVPNNDQGLSNNNVLAISGDHAGNIWIGTDGGGMDRFDPVSRTFQHYRNDPQQKNSLNSNVVFSIVEMEPGLMGMGLLGGGGFDILDVKTGAFIHHKFNASDTTSLSNEVVLTVHKDRLGNVWLGTVNGLNCYNKRTGSFIRYMNDVRNPKSLITNTVLAIHEDRAGYLWVGTTSGIDRFDRRKNEFTHFHTDPDNQNGTGLEEIQCIWEDRNQVMWVGTRAGLHRFNRQAGTFTSFTEKDGLPNGLVFGIQEDRQGNLWLSTNKGLSKFSPQQKNFRNFSLSDGLQGQEFKRQASYQASNGEMYFGGVNGFNRFHPDSVKNNPFLPPVVITSFEIFNKPVEVGTENSPLQQHISQTKELTLSYQQSVFSFQFSALNYSSPEKNQYAYMLEGFDKNWNQIGTRRSVTYTNLEPGEYTLRVKASNNDAVWNDKGTSLKITITPPFWQTWWFRTLVTFTIIGSAITFYRIRMNAIKAQKAELEKQVKERTSEVMQQKEELTSQAEHLQTLVNELQETQEELMQQQEELQTQAEMMIQTNDELKEVHERVAIQRDHLQQVNEQVMSSIQYANTIQKAILPSQKKIDKVFPEHFIIYRPKDVVSGDFYWFAHLPKEETNLAHDITMIAVVDCTGHGVPGAFMGIIGSTLLNEIVNQKRIFDPAQILEHLHLGVKQAVEKSEGVNTAGMDVCLVCMESGEGDQVKLRFGGAKRDLLYVRARTNTLEKLVADRRSIGSEPTQAFTTKEITLEKGSLLYLTSDGYADQNNPLRQKFGSMKLKEVIDQAIVLSLKEQKQVFEKSLHDHQQDAEQRDDITLLGLRL